MDIHKNARLTLVRREQLAEFVVLQGKTLNSAAAEFKVCARTAAKWTRRYPIRKNRESPKRELPMSLPCERKG
jgi:transposase